MSADKMPTAKATAAGLGGFISALLMWAISASGVSIPDGVLVYVPALGAFLASYLTPDRLVKIGRKVEAMEHHDGAKRAA